MTDLLEDLTEEDLRDLVWSIRGIGTPYDSMSDAGILKEFLADRVDQRALVACCPVRKILLHILRRDGWALGDVPEALKDMEMCLAAMRSTVPTTCAPNKELWVWSPAAKRFRYVMEFVPKPIKASIMEALGLGRPA